MIKSENIQSLYNFIADTHPQIDGNYEEAVELRALRRDRTNGNPLLKSVIFYNNNQKQREEFEKQVKQLNGLNIPFCFYYSIYSFNPTKHKRINKDDAQRTQILCADFDHIDQHEFDVILEDLKKKGLEPNYSIFSGHGFQIIYKLKTASANKALQEEFTLALVKNGFPVDEKIKDSARIMRLPFTENNKNPNDPIETFIYSQKSGAYDLKEIWRKLGTEEPEPVKDLPEDPHNKYYDDRILYETYIDTRLNVNTLPEPIKSMLMGFRNGKTDKMTKSLVLYFRDYVGMTQKEITEVFEAMKKLNTFNYTGNRWQTIKGDIENLYRNKNYKFNYSDVEEFGSVQTFYKLKKNDTTAIYNDIFSAEAYDSKSKSYKPVSNIAFVIYLRLLYNQTTTGVKSYTMEEIEKICNKSARRLNDKIKELCSAGLIDKARAHKTTGNAYRYTLNGLKVKEHKGFTQVNTVVLQSMLMLLDEGELNETALKFLLYMKMIVERAKGEEVEIDQQSIAKALNISRTAVVKMWKKLEECKIKYIGRTANWIQTDKNGKVSYSYNIYF